MHTPRSFDRHRRKLPDPPPSTAAARELAAQVQALGEDLDALLRKAGLPFDAAALLDPKWRGPLTRDAFAKLYAECTWALDARAARQEGRAPMTKPEIDLLAYSIINCATLKDAIARAATFSAMVAPRTAPLSLHVDAGVAEFHMSTERTRRNVSAFVSDLTGLSMHHRLFGWLIGHEIELLDVQLRYPPLLSAEAVAWLMPHPITYNAADNLLRFPARYLHKPVVRNYAELVRLLERFPFDLEESQSIATPVSEGVRTLLGAALAHGAPLPTIQDLARQFALSPATLKRRLAEEGASLNGLKAASRCDLAQRFLADGRLNVSQIAGRLGFSDTSTFSRAFSRWTGVSPAAWRKSSGDGFTID
jgi:AraC-like DNA-binding protein